MLITTTVEVDIDEFYDEAIKAEYIKRFQDQDVDFTLRSIYESLRLDKKDEAMEKLTEMIKERLGVIL